MLDRYIPHVRPVRIVRPEWHYEAKLAGVTPIKFLALHVMALV